MSRQINPFQDNPFLEIGRILSEESYKREEKGVRLEGIEIDVLKTKDGNIVIGEVKKSSRFELSARMQLSYYLLKLKQKGINAKGELLFPAEKKKIEVLLTEEIENELKRVEKEIDMIIRLNLPPQIESERFCKKCAYEEFCYS